MSLASLFTRFGRPVIPEDVSRAYKALFTSQLGLNEVLPDLAEFCHASEPAPPVSDLFVQGRHAGWRDVFLHIQELTALSDDQVRELYMTRVARKA